MKIVLCLLLSLAATVAGASPVNTFALVVNSHGPASTTSGAVHSGQLLPASSKISVPTGSSHVDLQLTGDAIYAPADSSPAAVSGPETLVRVEPGSTLSISKLEATDTGVGTVRRIKLQLVRGSVLVSARRLPALSSFDILAPAGRVSISGGTVEVSDHSVAVAAGEAVVYPRDTVSKAAAPVVITSGHSYDTRAEAVSVLPLAADSTIVRRAAGLHSVGFAHLSFSDDSTGDYVSPIHPGHHHHHHHRHHPHDHDHNPPFMDSSSGQVSSTQL